VGAALSPSGTINGGYQAGGINSPDGIAIDLLGNAWIANSNGTLTALSPTGSAISPSAGFSGGGLTGLIGGLAVDGLGNIWAANPGSISWLAGANAAINGVAKPIGTPLSPPAGLTQGISNPSGAIGVDTSGTIWVLNSGNGSGSAAELNGATGSLIQTDVGYQQTVPAPSGSVLGQGVGYYLAIDNAGDVLTSIQGNEIAELKAGGSASLGTGTFISINNLANYSPSIALDGANHLWLLASSINCASVSGFAVEVSSSGALLNTNTQLCGYAGPNVDPSSDVALAVDGSGNLWVLGAGSMTEFIGVAAPVVTPFSLGVQNKTLGKKP